MARLPWQTVAVIVSCCNTHLTCTIQKRAAIAEHPDHGRAADRVGVPWQTTRRQGANKRSIVGGSEEIPMIPESPETPLDRPLSVAPPP